MNVNIIPQVWRTMRPSTLPLSIAPYMIGTAFAAPIIEWHAGYLLIGLVGVIALHFSSNAVNEWFDFESGADQLAAETPDNIPTNPGTVLSGKISLRQLQKITFVMLNIATLCGLILTFRRSLIIGGAFLLGGLLAFFYTAPPLALSYRGHGLGEFTILVSAGLLPTVIGYTTQAGELTLHLLSLAMPWGILAATLLTAHDFLHWRTDKAIGKYTPVVVFGHSRAWLLLGILLIGSYVSFGLNIAMELLPKWVLVSLLTAIPTTYSWIRFQTQATAESYFTFIRFVSQTHCFIASLTFITLLAWT